VEVEVLSAIAVQRLVETAVVVLVVYSILQMVKLEPLTLVLVVAVAGTTELTTVVMGVLELLF
jgi:hypothetical protein